MNKKTKIIVIVTTLVVIVCGFGEFFVLRIVDYPIAAGELPQAIIDAQAVGIPLTSAELAPGRHKSATEASYIVLQKFRVDESSDGERHAASPLEP